MDEGAFGLANALYDKILSLECMLDIALQLGEDE